MPKEMRICKTCGKEYEACHTPNRGVFRWRDIACSYECALKYIEAVEKARGNAEEAQPAAEEPVVAEPIVTEEPVAEEPVEEHVVEEDIPTNDYSTLNYGYQTDFFVNTGKRNKRK